MRGGGASRSNVFAAAEDIARAAGLREAPCEARPAAADHGPQCLRATCQDKCDISWLNLSTHTASLRGSEERGRVERFRP